MTQAVKMALNSNRNKQTKHRGVHGPEVERQPRNHQDSGSIPRERVSSSGLFIGPSTQRVLVYFPGSRVERAYYKFSNNPLVLHVCSSSHLKTLW